MFPVIQIGPAAVQVSGLLLLLAVWIATLLIEHRAAQTGLSPGDVGASLATGLIVGILGARLSFVVGHWGAYAPTPLDALALSPTALDPLGGALLGLIAWLVVAFRKRIPMLPLLDTMAPGLALFLLFRALARLASGDAFGLPSDVPWAIPLWGAQRHPSQLYEALAAFAMLALLSLRKDRVPGRTFVRWAALFTASELLIEASRSPTHLGPAGIRLPQLGALAGLLASLWLFGRITRRHSTPTPRGDQVHEAEGVEA